MSTNVKRSKEMPREECIETKMKRILADITSIDEQTKRLAKQRETLLEQYEELKDVKLIRDAQACSVEEDWENGIPHNKKHSFLFFFVLSNNCYLTFQKTLIGHSA